MNGLLKNILGSFAIAIGVVDIAFFKYYHGSIIPYPFLVYGSGVLCFFAGIYLLIRIPVPKQVKDDQDKFSISVKDLKENGNSIHVDLTKCELLENNYFEEKDEEFRENASDLEMLLAARTSAYADEIDDVPVDIEIFQSRAVYKANYKGKEKTFFSHIIAKDRETILFKFYAQKSTSIYIDKTNAGIYYFDVEFMDK